jgi:hypothetical protein
MGNPQGTNPLSGSAVVMVGAGATVLTAGVGAVVVADAAGTTAAEQITANGIRAINKSLGGTTELTGKAETVISNMAYREGAESQAATAIRDIAGRHLFDDANKRTAQAVAERLLGSGANAAKIRSVIDSVATGVLRSVEDIAKALGH